MQAPTLATSSESLIARGWKMTHESDHVIESTWQSPSRQILHVIQSSTRPSFLFAFNPGDSDMERIRQRRVVEPALTSVWQRNVLSCCSQGHTVIDVGANFGWYSLLALAMGCNVAAFEPISHWREGIELAVALNGHKFASKLQLFPMIVYPIHGSFTMWAPSHLSNRIQMGATTMDNLVGRYKRIEGSLAHNATSARLDEFAFGHVCMLKVDVEGNEPQVLHTAKKLVSSGSVEALQLEITRSVHGGPSHRERQNNNQTCAIIKTLEHLVLMGYQLHSVSWSSMAKQSKKAMQTFPSADAVAVARRRGVNALRLGYLRDFLKSTNIVALRSTSFVGTTTTAYEWPSLSCPVGRSLVHSKKRVNDCFGPYEC